MRECARCGARPAPRRCSACRSVWYCSKACQVEHWKGAHKRLCAQLKDGATAPATAADTTKGGQQPESRAFGAQNTQVVPHWSAYLPFIVPGTHYNTVRTRSKKPTYDEFNIPATDIGSGNFSRVMKATHIKVHDRTHPALNVASTKHYSPYTVCNPPSDG